ncbi:hypothetical protein Smp_197950 [Schistosoma mansoni]|uniref:Ig-like domain-containing protein n=1 Tax=Schistosoma mansoni TaxID=6183 RepID=G4VH78_SCHMA|nr:hypothetical protein Smp_197950 [Schistosoma mansoni]|eukprot:XP_018652345.1 hypothetical protein Smp_197950 [Schistosoma mansoni]
MRNPEKSENLWCFSFIQHLMNKYLNFKTMQSHENYITLKQNDINVQYRRQSLNEMKEKSKNLLRKSTTMLLDPNQNQMSLNSILHYNPLESTSFSQSYEPFNNELNSSQIWKCPHCLTEIQLIKIQNTPEIIQSHRQNKGIRTNPWIYHPKLELNNTKSKIPVTSCSISSSLTDSGIYLCTDSGSRCGYITRSTTETEINKNNYFNVHKNDIPIIPISPDPPPSPAPKCTQCIISPDCLEHTSLPFEVNENRTLLNNSKTTYKGFCKSATLDLSNLVSETNESINRPRRKLLTKRVRNQMRRSWLQTTAGSKLLPYLSPSLHLDSSSSSSSSCKSPSSEHKVTLSADETISCCKNDETESIIDKHNLLSKQPDTNVSDSQIIEDNELSKSIISTFIQNMSPELIKSINLSNNLNFSTVYNDNLNINEDNLYDDIQLENLRTNLKILSEAKNVINMQMRNLGQNYINYLKNKYLINTMKNQ